MNAEEFRQLLLASSDGDVVRDTILSGSAAHVTDHDVAHIARRLAEAYGASSDYVKVWIVGSAKLGYSISEKRLQDGTVLPRFRLFRIESDIDVAVVSAPIFDAIWSDLSINANRAPRMPWNSEKLGDYLVHGWIRPDYFPQVPMRHCDAWWNAFRLFSVDARFQRRRVRGGLFYSVDDLVRYQSRSVAECRRELESQL